MWWDVVDREAWRKMLTRHYKLLVEILPVDDILPSLLSKNVITHRQMEDIKSRDTEDKRAEKLVDILMRLDPQYYESCMEVLYGRSPSLFPDYKMFGVLRTLEFSKHWELLKHIVAERAEQENLTWEDCPELPPPGPVEKKMISVASSFEDETFEKISENIAVSTSLAAKNPALTQTANKLFRCGFTWEGVAALHSFAGTVGVQFIRKGMPHVVEEVGKWLARYIANNLQEEITRNGGWDAFVRHFENGPSEEAKRGLMNSVRKIPRFSSPETVTLGAINLRGVA